MLAVESVERVLLAGQSRRRGCEEHELVLQALSEIPFGSESAEVPRRSGPRAVRFRAARRSQQTGLRVRVQLRDPAFFRADALLQRGPAAAAAGTDDPAR